MRTRSGIFRLWSCGYCGIKIFFFISPGSLQVAGALFGQTQHVRSKIVDTVGTALRFEIAPLQPHTHTSCSSPLKNQRTKSKWMGNSYYYAGSRRSRRARATGVGASLALTVSVLAWWCCLKLLCCDRRAVASAFQLSPTTKPQEVIERQLEALRGDDMGEVYRFA